MKNYDVIIFGGSSGIGLASSLLFNLQNMSVLSVSRTAESNDQLKQSGIDAKNCDITNLAAVKELVADIHSAKHIVLTTSNPLYFENIKNLDIDKIKHSYNQVWSYITIIQELLQQVKDIQSITLLSGAIADNNIPGTLGLKLIASSINQMVKTLAVELAPIRINAVSPGIVDTSLYNNIPDRQQMLTNFANNTPLKIITQAEEIANAIHFVALNSNISLSSAPILIF
jgi:NAD(P)-dependent dehydrogenase (short-subunit alcohol dehydrogenase family)